MVVRTEPRPLAVTETTIVKSIQLPALLSLPAGPGKAKQVLAANRLKVILIRLAGGEILPDHQAPGSITIHCVMGKLTLQTGDESLTLECGSIVCLEAEIVHRLEAFEDSAILLTIASSS